MSLNLCACFSEVSESQAQGLSLLSLSLPPLPSPLPPFLWLCSVFVSRYEWHFAVQHRRLRSASPTFQAILIDHELWSTRLILYSFLGRCLVFQCILPEKNITVHWKVPFICIFHRLFSFSSLKRLQFYFTVWWKLSHSTMWMSEIPLWHKP